MKVHWTRNAIQHLAKIHDYITLNSPLYARGVVDKITRHSARLADHPYWVEKCPNTTPRTFASS